MWTTNKNKGSVVSMHAAYTPFRGAGHALQEPQEKRQNSYNTATVLSQQTHLLISLLLHARLLSLL